MLRATHVVATALLTVGVVSTAWSDEPICQQPWPDGEQVAELSDDTIDESSGLADSWLHHDRLWTHNDSGDEPRLWALRKDGTVTTTLHLEGAENVDWEDMAIAPCTADDDRPCIYVGDFGDNLSRRDDVTIYRFPEPDLGDDPPPEFTVTEFETLVYRYDTGPRDAETLLVHPHTRQIWVIEKTGETLVDVFSIPEDFDNPEPLEVSPVATLEIPGSLPLIRMITAGDISPDGTEFTFRTYVEVYTHCTEDLDDFETAFHTPASRVVLAPPTIQGEALTYDRQDGALWLTSEQLPAPLIRLPPRGEDPEPPDVADPQPDAGHDTDTDAGHEADTDSEPSAPEPTSGGCSALPTSTPSLAIILLALLAFLNAKNFKRNEN